MPRGTGDQRAVWHSEERLEGPAHSLDHRLALAVLHLLPHWALPKGFPDVSSLTCTAAVQWSTPQTGKLRHRGRNLETAWSAGSSAQIPAPAVWLQTPPWAQPEALRSPSSGYGEWSPMPGAPLPRVVTTQRSGSARSAWTHLAASPPGRAGECGRCATPDCETIKRRESLRVTYPGATAWVYPVLTSGSS